MENKSILYGVRVGFWITLVLVFVAPIFTIEGILSYLIYYALPVFVLILSLTSWKKYQDEFSIVASVLAGTIILQKLFFLILLKVIFPYS